MSGLIIISNLQQQIKGEIKMNTANLADISEIIGSMAVVITLIFLVLQMRENTRAIKALPDRRHGTQKLKF